MLYALADGARVAASKGLEASCPCCRSPVLAKCGEILAHHWAHVSVEDCDSWSEGESDWHADWKALFPEPWREVVVGPHRADVRAPNGFVVELQHSSISPEEIREREAFYGTMLWVFDAAEPYADGRLMWPRGELLWKNPRTSVSACKSPVLLDLGDGYILELGPRRFEFPFWPTWPTAPCSAHRMSKTAFLAGVQSQALTKTRIFGWVR